MKKMYYFFLLTFLIYSLEHAPLLAQGEKLGIRFENRGSASLNNPKPDIAEDTKVNFFTIALNASWKSKIDKQKLGLTTLTLGAEYRLTNLNYEQLTLPVGSTQVENLHMLRLQIDYMKIIKQKWILSVFARPGIFTDFEEPDFKHTRLEGLVLFDRIKNQKTIYGIGVGRSAGFGRVLILPILHYLYRTPTFVADILLPSRVDVGWIKAKWYLGLNMSLSGNQFRLGNLQNGFPDSNVLGVSDVTVGPSIRYNTSKTTYFLLEGGMTGLRRWEFRNDDRKGDERFVQEFDPNLTWFARVGFVLKHK